jgi:hypothetical protein
MSRRSSTPLRHANQKGTNVPDWTFLVLNNIYTHGTRCTWARALPRTRLHALHALRINPYSCVYVFLDRGKRGSLTIHLDIKLNT